MFVIELLATNTVLIVLFLALQIAQTDDWLRLRRDVEHTDASKNIADLLFDLLWEHKAAGDVALHQWS